MKSIGFLLLFTSLAILLAAAQSNSVSPHNQPGTFPVRDLPAGASAQRAQAQRGRLAAPPSGSDPLIFLSPGAYSSGGSDPSGVAVADLNHDNKADIVVANYNSSSLGVLLGNGDGTFQSPASYPTGGASAGAVAIGDINSDGKPDLIVANQCATSNTCTSGGTVSVLLGNGDGTFRTPVVYSSGGYLAYSVAIADLNGDTKPDLVVANACQFINCSGSSGGVAVLMGNGNGTFQPAVTYSAGPGVINSAFVSVEDLNGDTHPDLVIVSNCLEPCTDGAASVLLGNGDGTFKAAVVYDSGGQFPTSGAVADVSGDGKADLLVANYDPHTVAVMVGNGDGTFQSPVNYPTGGFDRFFAIGDVNNDGKPDVIADAFCSSCGYADGLSVILGNGDGTFQTPVIYILGGSAAGSLALADVNGDQLPDVTVVLGFSNQVAVLLNNNNAPPSTAVLTPSVNPVNLNQSVTYLAKVSIPAGGTLAGKVTFTDKGKIVATVSLVNNQAAYTTSYTTRKLIGTRSIAAIYSGQFSIAKGSQATITEYVRGNVTKTVVATSKTPSKFGEPVFFTTTVTANPLYGPIPDGELVSFYDKSKFLASVALASGKATYTSSTLSVGKHTIKATYSGDNTFKPSSGHVAQVVDP